MSSLKTDERRVVEAAMKRFRLILKEHGIRELRDRARPQDCALALVNACYALMKSRKT